jgi:hypothetical protein
MHQDCRVPPEDGTDALFEAEIPRVWTLLIDGNRVEIRSLEQRRQPACVSLHDLAKPLQDVLSASYAIPEP